MRHRGAKLWPALLLPAPFRQRATWQITRKRIALAAVVFIALTAAIFSPMFLAAEVDPGAAGVAVYAATWQMNDTLYQVFHLFGSWITPSEAPSETAHRAARLMVGFVLLIWIVWLQFAPCFALLLWEARSRLQIRNDLHE